MKAKKDGRGGIAQSYGKFGSRRKKTKRKTSTEMVKQCEEGCNEYMMSFRRHSAGGNKEGQGERTVHTQTQYYQERRL